MDHSEGGRSERGCVAYDAILKQPTQHALLNPAPRSNQRIQRTVRAKEIGFAVSSAPSGRCPNVKQEQGVHMNDIGSAHGTFQGAGLRPRGCKSARPALGVDMDGYAALAAHGSGEQIVLGVRIAIGGINGNLMAAPGHGACHVARCFGRPPGPTGERRDNMQNANETLPLRSGRGAGCNRSNRFDKPELTL